MHLSKIIPQCVHRQDFTWIKRGFATMSIEYRMVRAKVGGGMDKCNWCGYEFVNGDAMALAGRPRGRNWMLCQTCAQMAESPALQEAGTSLPTPPPPPPKRVIGEYAPGFSPSRRAAPTPGSAGVAIAIDESMPSSSRLGRFTAASKFLDLENIAARRLMGKVMILDVRRHWERDEVEYFALCEDFDECPLGMVVPEYRVEVHGDPVQIRFVAVEASARATFARYVR